MRKLRAIWQLIKADKWALFTYENAPEDPVWATFPFFGGTYRRNATTFQTD